MNPYYGKDLNEIADRIIAGFKTMLQPPEAVGAMTVPAHFVVSNIIGIDGHSTRKASIVRESPKKHGTRSDIEKELPEGTTIVVIDISDEAIEFATGKFLAAGYQVVGSICLRDWLLKEVAQTASVVLKQKL